MRGHDSGSLTFFLCRALELQEFAVYLVKIAEVGWSLVGELFVEVVCTALFVLVFLPALEQLFDTGKLFRAAKVPGVDNNVASLRRVKIRCESGKRRTCILSFQELPSHRHRAWRRFVCNSLHQARQSDFPNVSSREAAC